METVLGMLLSSGNVVGIVSFVVCYLVIYFQRKFTAEKRNKVEEELRLQIKLAKEKAEAAEIMAQQKIESAVEEMKTEINTLKTEKLLMAKDIDILKTDTTEVRADVRDIKNILSDMAVSIAQLAAAAEVKVKINEDKR